MQKRFFILIVSFLISNTILVGQNRKQLEKERKKVEIKIKKINNLLFKTKKAKSNALEDLKDLDQKIKAQNELIQIINLEINALSKEITTNNKEVQKLNNQITELKKDYANIISKSYKNRSRNHMLKFLLSSSDFTQAYKRLKYMKQYTDFRKEQAYKIVEQTAIIQQLNDSLANKKQLKTTLASKEDEHKKAIAKDVNKQEALVSKIKKEEKTYKKELQRKIKENRRLTARIDYLIKLEIEKSNKVNRKNKKSSSKKSSTKFILSPKAKILAKSFEKNKGKLPRPVKRGLIVRRFGTQSHPTIAGIKIYSPGIHIATSKGAIAKSVFKGNVMNILKQAEGKKTIMIRHGNYITVYKNISISYVEKGDTVNTNEKIGEIFTDRTNGKTILVFALLKNTKRLNPSKWLL